MANAIEQLDAKIAEVFAAWNIYTTIIALVLAAFIVYPIIFWDEPDTHPLLLARQSTASAIRYPGESAIYRSIEVPHGYPLKTGLSVKDPGAPKWTAGKDGDLRDVWREAARGGTTPDSSSPAGLIMTVYGKDAAVDHDLSDISKAINVIGLQLQHTGAKRVAIYLPNSVEYLATIFGNLHPRLHYFSSLTIDSLRLLRSHPHPDPLQPASPSCLQASRRHWCRVYRCRRWFTSFS